MESSFTVKNIPLKCVVYTVQYAMYRYSKQWMYSIQCTGTVNNECTVQCTGTVNNECTVQCTVQ